MDMARKKHRRKDCKFKAFWKRLKTKILKLMSTTKKKTKKRKRVRRAPKKPRLIRKRIIHYKYVRKR